MARSQTGPRTSRSKAFSNLPGGCSPGFSLKLGLNQLIEVCQYKGQLLQQSVASLVSGSGSFEIYFGARLTLSKHVSRKELASDWVVPCLASDLVLIKMKITFKHWAAIEAKRYS